MMASKLKNIAVWSLFNFACTIYSINIISLHFALWVTVDLQGADIFYSFAFSASLLLAALCAPLIGYYSDRLDRRMPFIIIFSILCFLGTAALGLVHSLFAALIIFTFTNFCYQCADVIQNMLIPQISNGENAGQVAGYGTGFGYFGTIAGVLLVSPVVTRYGHQAAFIPTAILFLIFAIPSFIFLKDPKNPAKKSNISLLEVFAQPFKTLVNIKKYPDIAASLLAIFLAFNSIDTVFVFMSVYLKKVVGFVDTEFTLFYVGCSIFAILGGIICGFVVDAIGAKKVLIGAIVLWCLALFLAMFASNKNLFWVIGSMIGVSLGATWTSSKTLIMDLAPKEQSGEFFGFYGFVIKIAAIVGPLVWGICVWLFGFSGMLKYRLTIGVLLLVLLSGLLFLRKVSGRVQYLDPTILQKY